MPHCVASDLGLRCLHMSHKKDARLIWIKHTIFSRNIIGWVLNVLVNAKDNLLCISIEA